MQFTLTAVDDDGTVTTKEFDSVFLKDTVEKTADFLRGTGFFFDELEIVVNEETPFSDRKAPETLEEAAAQGTYVRLQLQQPDRNKPE